MNIRTLLLSALAASTLHALPAFAQAPDILHATLAEPTAKTPEISTAQMREVVVKGGAIILDTRSRLEFDAGHIPGAANLDSAPNIAVTAVEKLTANDKTKTLVLYCNGPFCQASRRFAEQLADAGFSNIRRYQLGMPVWRALGGPTEVALGGIERIHSKDGTAVFLDLRTAEQFAKKTLAGAINTPLEDVMSGKIAKLPLPEDDFNRRIILVGATPSDARKLAEILSKRPWHNVSYYGGSTEELLAKLARN